jgi:predicted nucleic acid-binding protein
MILCDAGPLVALIDQAETENGRNCKVALLKLRPPLVTTWPCFTEAMYFLSERGGLPLQKMLWRFIETGQLGIHSQSDAEAPRMQALMETYHDAPMDFADASLVVAAEDLGITRIFTLDSHFYAYRINGKTSFEVIP